MVRLHWSGGLFGYLTFTIVFAVAGILLGAGPAFVESVGDELAVDAAATLPDDDAVVTLRGFAPFSSGLLDTSGSVEQALAAIDGLRDPVTTYALGDLGTTARGSVETSGGVILFARDGATENLDIVSGGGPETGVLMSETLAARLEVSPGDEVIVNNRVWELMVSVRGIYRDIAEVPGPYWLDIPGELLPQSRAIFGGRVEPELLVTDAATLTSLAAGGEVRPDTDVDDQPAAQLFAGRVWFEAFLGPVDGIVDLRRLSDEVVALEGQAQDPATELGIAVAVAGVDDVTLRTPLVELRTEVDEALDGTEPAIGLVSVAATMIALLVVGLGAWFVAQRRERDLRIWRVDGRSPLVVAAMSGAGAVPAAVGGTVLGAVAAPFLVGAFGPSGISHTETTPVVGLALFALAGLVTVAAATAIVAIRVREVRPEPRSQWMWDLALYGAAVVLLAQALLRSGGIDPGALDLVTLLVPLMAIAALVVAGLRLLGLGLRRARHSGSGLAPAALLAWRRTTAAVGSRLGIMLPIGIATGVALFAAGLVAAGDTAIFAKARVIVGGDVAFATVGVPESTPEGAVLVRASTASVQTGIRVWLVVLDPDDFGDSVGWLSSFGTDVDTFLAALAPRPSARVPAVAAGPGADELAALGGVRFQSLTLAYEIADTIEAIPLMSISQPTLAVRSDALVEWIARNPLSVPEFIDADSVDLSVVLRGMPPRLISSAGSADSVRRQLEESGERVREVTTTADVTALPAFAGQRWAFDYLRLIALASLLLSFAVFVFAMAESRRRLVVADALTRRMGLGRAASSVGLGLEIGALVVVPVVMGVMAAGGLSWLLVDRFDPLPDVSPLLELAVPGTDLVIVGATAALLAGVTWLASRMATRRIDPAEVLRG